MYICVYIDIYVYIFNVSSKCTITLLLQINFVLYCILYIVLYDTIYIYHHFSSRYQRLCSKHPIWSNRCHIHQDKAVNVDGRQHLGNHMCYSLMINHVHVYII